MGFRCEYEMFLQLIEIQRTRAMRLARPKDRCIEALDGTAVVLELDDIVLIGGRLRVGYHVEQSLVFFNAINEHGSSEEPVAAVFAVRLSKVEALDARWIALQFRAEQIRVEVQVPIVERETCK